MRKRYQLSGYVKRFDRKGYSALFNGLTLKKAYARKGVMNAALRKPNFTYRLGVKRTTGILIKHGFIVSPGTEEKILGRIRKRIGKIDISNIVLLVSNDCNYACAYCQIEENMNRSQRQHDLSVGLAKRALDLFEMNCRVGAKKTITITGGEPLMNIETVRYIVERSKKIPHTRAIIFTNGSLVTPGLARYFSKKGTLILVSLDGPAAINDKVRTSKTGHGTFEAALRGYRFLKMARCRTGISAVTGKHNVNRMDEVSKFFLRMKPPSIGLNFGHYLLGKKNPAAIEMATFARLLVKFYKKMRRRHIFVENISRFITPFYQEKVRLNECQAQGSGLCVDSRGKVGVCKSLLVSDVISIPIDAVSKNISKEPVFLQWAKRSPFTLPACAGCTIIGLCGGGCAYDSFVLHKGDIGKIDRAYCEYARAITRFLLWDLFDGIKDKIRDGIYIPSVREQERKYTSYFKKNNQLQRSVGHEKDR